MEVIDSSISAILQSDDMNFENGKEILSLSQQVQGIIDNLVQTNSEMKTQVESSNDKIEHHGSDLEKLHDALNEQIEKTRDKVKIEEDQGEKLAEQMKKLVSELTLQKAEMVEVCDEAVQKVPKEKYICSVLKNITNIEWDVKKGDPDVVCGAFVTKQDIKRFTFKLEKNSNIVDIKESIWGMMKDWQQFENCVPNEK